MCRIKRKLVGRHKKPQQKSEDRPQPPTMSEDIFLRKGIPFKPLIIPDDESSPPPSKRSSFHSSKNSFVNNIDSRTRASKGALTMKVLVPAGLEPGKNVKLRYPDGRKFLACIPPRTQWLFENCDGEPRPFFLAPGDPTTVEPHAPPPSTKPSQVHPVQSEPKTAHRSLR